MAFRFGRSTGGPSGICSFAAVEALARSVSKHTLVMCVLGVGEMAAIGEHGS